MNRTNDNAYTSGYFQSRFKYDSRRDKVWPIVCRYLARFLPDDAAVLDLGAGYCSFINHVKASEKHAVDVFAGFAEYARQDVKTHIVHCDDLHSFSSEHFDVVFASNLLEHLTDEKILATLTEVKRVLKLSGRFILIQPNFKYGYREYFDDYTHLKVFTDVSLPDLLRANGFFVERIEPRFLPISMKSRFPKWSWLVRLYLMSPLRPFAKQMLIVSRKQTTDGSPQ